ncbi:MAG TPA: ATP-binding protein [Chryseosolibacter sp.]|nr:ATP-binding protein [Chryseosolibacter sp.]
MSKVAWAADNNILNLVSKTLEILPKAMQHPELAETKITIDGNVYISPQFHKCKFFIDCSLTLDKKKYGNVTVGYRIRKKEKLTFLQEEKNLLKAVARELSLFIKRANVEADKEKLQIQLQHVERLAFVGELSAGIAHELNEPLGRILGFAQLIKKAGSMSPQQNEDIERIIKASLYTREIIKKLMIFSRQMPQQISKLNLNEIIDSILYFIDVRFQSRGIKIIKALDENLPRIEADEVQMSQVMVNLITNAVHAMPGGGEIVISSKKKGKQISLIVKDTGTGMPKEVKEKIFEPFFTTKPVGHGTGLGLSVVQGIINSHRGKIFVRSTPGKGSTFEILLPTTQR